MVREVDVFIMYVSWLKLSIIKLYQVWFYKVHNVLLIRLKKPRTLYSEAFFELPVLLLNFFMPVYALVEEDMFL